ncbi:ribonucleotide-diphosphate reductase subunit beta [Streptomyces sp. S07_1.15]|uniref:ribonucleotide-diphosphate reductase subunit beta n=1 Tax=Streptomyces sp. S07_1.15 TaxID=2873925 RepID=UPI001D14E5FE|nr:ribonucleotide-diphosphate reductase subunit beta [Streptomyces sp. S07_1.15]MCC3651645.1 ribonucleotide-diphosphate reductase subunit beta [Streptomyces sp. S07_1.15]
MTRWSTLLLDEASLAEMPDLPVDQVLRHADLVTAGRPKPQALYERWEKQQWSARAIGLERDREAFEKEISPAARQALTDQIATFITGEYTGLDLLGPILTGAPEEVDHLYLGTQIADETRHTQLMLRFGEELLGLDPDPKRMLVQAWNMVTPSHRELSTIEADVVRELQQHPSDYRRWLRAVTLFHLITEGVLALVGQRAILNQLHGTKALPGVKAGFTAMCRDESRHVSFGLHALRQGVKEGYGDDIREMLELSAPIALGIDHGDRPEEHTGDPTMTDLSVHSLRRQIHLIGLEREFADHLVTISFREPAADEAAGAADAAARA